MDQQRLSQELDDAKDRLESADSLVIETTNQPFDAFALRGTSLEEAVELGLELGAEVFYLLEVHDEDGEVQTAGICFYYENRPHSAIHRSEELIEPEEEAERRGSPFRDETEEERERRAELIDEILTEYEEYLSEDEQFELENHPERQSVRRLLRMRDRLERKDRTDPEEEKRLATRIYETEEFNTHFNQTDTEMLLNQLDVDYDPDLVRMDEVHKRAKSLLKIDG